ncbi:MAG: hypothetical protein KDC58_07740 [Cyclobacteriaceae bacterium]|nr:hypothetical protein [Cyclobacteriaceae bacterium]
MKYFLYLGVILLVTTSCQTDPSAQEIIDRSIEAHGGSKVYNSKFSFDFRDKHYEAVYINGDYTLSRQFTDSLNNQIKDVLTNSGFERSINDTLIILTDDWKTKYSNSVNSVIYFFRLPFNLTDPAVNLTYLGKGKIEGKTYFKIKVAFAKEAGGEDFTDQFVYWFNTQTYTMDYMAYEYATSGGGKRFRKAYNQRSINGWLISDYHNYEPLDISIDIEVYDQYFEKGGLKNLSEIVNRNVNVEFLDPKTH